MDSSTSLGENGAYRKRATECDRVPMRSETNTTVRSIDIPVRPTPHSTRIPQFELMHYQNTWQLQRSHGENTQRICTMDCETHNAKNPSREAGRVERHTHILCDKTKCATRSDVSRGKEVHTLRWHVTICSTSCKVSRRKEVHTLLWHVTKCSTSCKVSRGKEVRTLLWHVTICSTSCKTLHTFVPCKLPRSSNLRATDKAGDRSSRRRSRRARRCPPR